jgi:hypothetical protein
MSEPIFVCFRDKGDDPQGGGYVRCDTEAEKLELTAYFKDAGLKVTWTDKKGNTL